MVDFATLDFDFDKDLTKNFFKCANIIVIQEEKSMLYDTHMHTRFSGDSDAAPEDMIKTAREKGLTGLCFTDHLDIDYREEPHLFDLDFEKYFREMPVIKEKNESDDFHIGIGIEMGLQPYLAPKHHELLKKYDFDFVIGSVHVINGYDPYYENFYKNINVRDAYRTYFDQVLENIRAFDEYDTLGHLDYVVRYGLKYFGSPAADCPFEVYRSQIEKILRHLIMHGKSLEVNTGAFRYGMSEPNPSYQILQFYYDLGGRDITLGADAHEPKDVGIAFDTVVPRLKKIGFEYFNVYMNRMPVKMQL